MKTIVHSIRPGSGKNVFLVELTGNGETRTFTVTMHAQCETMRVEEREFGDVCRGNLWMPGKLVALVARVRRGEPVEFPVEIDNSRPADPT